jgi:phage baseplate assembly protein gpV
MTKKHTETKNANAKPQSEWTAPPAQEQVHAADNAAKTNGAGKHPDLGAMFGVASDEIKSPPFTTVEEAMEFVKGQMFTYEQMQRITFKCMNMARAVGRAEGAINNRLHFMEERKATQRYIDKLHRRLNNGGRKVAQMRNALVATSETVAMVAEALEK